MMEQLLIAVWEILIELSPPLIFGLLIAGVIHVFLPARFIERRLSGSSLRSVMEASLIGVPMPLCSCGVAPTAIGLKNDGASKGAATSFLISTPQTGVDSILVSATFLGWPFAIFKVFAAFITGVLGGVLVNATEKKEEAKPEKLRTINELPKSFWRRIVEVIRYSVFDLFAMLDIYLAAGVVLAALIAVFVPDGFMKGAQWTQGIGGMFLVLAISMPLYVCTTSSVPIAASLIAAGMPLGTALVFLMAGPATNIATVGMIYRALGGRVLGIYLGVVAVMSMAFGLLFDGVLGGAASEMVMHQHGGASWLGISSAIFISALMAFFIGKRIWKRLTARHRADVDAGADWALTVEGMTCGKCVAKVKNTIESMPGVTRADVNLESSRADIYGDGFSKTDISMALEKAGYKPGD
jgi:uncharacterized protein